MAPKTIPDEELKKLVGRAQELQNEANQSNTTRDAQHVAAELGIAPEFVNAAIAEKAKKEPATERSTAAYWVLALFLLLGLGGFYWWGWGSQVILLEVKQEAIIVSSHNTSIIETHHETHQSVTITNTNINTVSPEKITFEPEANLEKAFADQLALVEESRPIIGREAAALDELVVKFRASVDLQERITIMMRLNRGLHDPVFFKSPIGNAKAKSILEENSRLHTIFFFAKEH